LKKVVPQVNSTPVPPLKLVPRKTCCFSWS